MAISSSPFALRSITLALLLATPLLVLACSSDDGAASGSSGGDGSSGNGSSSSSGDNGGGSSSGAPSGDNLDEIDGIGMPISLPLCGNIVPGVSATDIEYTWSGAPAETNAYAVRLSKGPSEDKLTSMVARVQTETSIKVGEKVSGTMYRLDAYALKDRTPLCVLSGFNVTTAQ